MLYQTGKDRVRLVFVSWFGLDLCQASALQQSYRTSLFPIGDRLEWTIRLRFSRTLPSPLPPAFLNVLAIFRLKPVMVRRPSAPAVQDHVIGFFRLLQHPGILHTPGKPAVSLPRAPSTLLLFSLRAHRRRARFSLEERRVFFDRGPHRVRGSPACLLRDLPRLSSPDK